jgi:hypothetical protein
LSLLSGRTFHLAAGGLGTVFRRVLRAAYAPGVRSYSTSAPQLQRSPFSDVRRERLFLASVAFYLTVFTVRMVTLAIHFGVGGLHDVSVHGTHIQHLVWGILLLLVVGCPGGSGGGSGKCRRGVGVEVQSIDAQLHTTVLGSSVRSVVGRHRA